MTAAVDHAFATCVHCGTVVPSGRDDDYCCNGCEIVHAAIREHGLEQFYALREAPVPAHASRRDYGELDDPAFERVHVQLDTDGTARTALYLEDLRCGACVWLVETTPRCVPGAIEVRVDLGRSRCDVTWDPAVAQLSAVARHLDRLGHAAHPYRGLDRDAQRRREDRALLVKLGVAGAAAGNLMLLAIALYAGLFGGMSRADATFFRWASMVVAVPALGFASTPFFRTAIAALRARRLHLDLPLSIGIAAGLVGGTANVLRGTGEIYFDSLAMLVFLLLVARWIALRYQRRAASAAELLLALTPSRARRVDPGGIVEVPIEAIVPGDRISVLVGDPFPVDGTVAEGRSAVDAGLLTGESLPIDVLPGAEVHAGTVNVAAPIVVVATAVGEATRVGALVATIEAMASRKTDIERLVDRVAGRFVAVVTTIAVLTLVGWWIARSFAAGAESAMSLLVVTCPCALALATPLAVTVALGRAARRGILIKGADALERLATPGTLFLDKTGTLTEGRLAIVGWTGDTEVAQWAAALEGSSNHPIARAFAGHAMPLGTATDVREELGRGITGTVAGHRIAVGAPPWVLARSGVRPSAIASAIEAAIERGETPVTVAVDGRELAAVGIADPIRADARAAIAALRALGWQLRILSGDEPRVVGAVGRALGVPPEHCAGHVSPEAKREIVEAAVGSGPVVMVGDGINDAAAMAAATCGIAVSGAAEIAIEAADIYLRSPSIEAITETIEGARSTLATIRRSLAISVAYNLVAGTLAVTGVIHPLIAALMMPISSLTVLTSSLRSRAFRSRQ